VQSRYECGGRTRKEEGKEQWLFKVRVVNHNGSFVCIRSVQSEEGDGVFLQTPLFAAVHVVVSQKTTFDLVSVLCFQPYREMGPESKENLNAFTDNRTVLLNMVNII